MFTRQETRDIRDQLQAKLNDIAKEMGMSLTLGNARFGDTIEFRLECAKLGKENEQQSRTVLDFKAYAGQFGLKPDYLGKTFNSRGRSYTIAGLKMSCRKYPVLCKRDDGRMFKFPVNEVNNHLGNSSASGRSEQEILKDIFGF